MWTLDNVQMACLDQFYPNANSTGAFTQFIRAVLEKSAYSPTDYQVKQWLRADLGGDRIPPVLIDFQRKCKERHVSSLQRPWGWTITALNAAHSWNWYDDRSPGAGEGGRKGGGGGWCLAVVMATLGGSKRELSRVCDMAHPTACWADHCPALIWVRGSGCWATSIWESGTQAWIWQEGGIGCRGGQF